MSEPAGSPAPVPSQQSAPAASGQASTEPVDVASLVTKLGALENSVMRLTRLVGKPTAPSAPAEPAPQSEPETLKVQLHTLRTKLDEAEKRAASQARTAAVSSALGFLEKPAYVKAFTRQALTEAGDRLKVVAGESGDEVVYEDETGNLIPVEAYVASFAKANDLHALRPVQPVASRGMRPSGQRSAAPAYSQMTTDELAKLTPQQRHALALAEYQGAR